MEQWASDLVKVYHDLWQTTLAYLPRIAGAMLLLLAGWITARLLRLLIFRLAQRIGRWGNLDRELKATGVDDVAPRAVFAAMLTGFAGTVVLYWLPGTPGDWAERLVPLAASLVICLAGSRGGGR